MSSVTFSVFTSTAFNVLPTILHTVVLQTKRFDLKMNTSRPVALYLYIQVALFAHLIAPRGQIRCFELNKAGKLTCLLSEKFRFSI